MKKVSFYGFSKSLVHVMVTNDNEIDEITEKEWKTILNMINVIEKYTQKVWMNSKRMKINTWLKWE
jgi:hypothetical protein